MNTPVKKSELLQRQNDEVDVLKSIFGDDFVEKKTKRGIDKAFYLKLDGFGEEIRGLVAIELHVRLGEKYPLLPPLLSIESVSGVNDEQVEALLSMLIDKARELLGSEMTFDLATLAQQYITENNVAIRRNQHRGLHAEMLSRKEKHEQEQHEKLEQERQEAEDLRLKGEQEENLKQVIQYEEEIRRKQEQLEEERQRRRRQRHSNHNLHEPTDGLPPSYSINMDVVNNSPNIKSRYHSDFQELEFLGKGGYGVVCKVRNRVDGHVYAIKKIRIVPGGDVSKLLREVQSLSRIQNQYIVRYYQSWFEESDGSVWHGDESDYSSEEDDDDEGSDMDDEGQNHHTISDWLASREMSRSRSFLAGAGGQAMDGVLASSPPNSSAQSPSGVDEPHAAHKHHHNSTPKMERVLYIQMEHCEKRTLRDLIDEGPLTDNEIWRFLRQIVEGLAEIHRQGMIHRDLKPGNIFLDRQSNIKIGDFGLATSKPTSTPLASDVVPTLETELLTEALGTPVYVAPEMHTIKDSISRQGLLAYNNKVDMYSLGIVLFEMCLHFSTAMERAICLRELRRPEILFPAEFDIKRHEQKAKIIKWLLSHNPKARPSCLELLSSPLMPPMLEEEKLTEALRLMTNVENPLYFPRLSRVLFSKVADKHKDAAFDFNSEAISLRPDVELATKRVHDSLKLVFERHGGLEISSPLLIPKTDLYEENKHVASLMDPDGNVVQLPYDLTVPFARFISRIPQNVVRLKRFAFGRVYRENRAKGQPQSVYEADFDIIAASGGDSVADAEIIKIGIEAVNEVPELNPSDYVVRIGHGRILDAVLDHCKFQRNPETRRSVYQTLEQLDKPSTWSQIRKVLQQTSSRTCLDLLESFVSFKGDFEVTAQKLQSHLSGEALTATKSGLQSLKRVIELLHIMNHNLMFQLCTIKRRKVDVIAAGGRYDHLMDQLRLPFGPSQSMLGVGISFALDKMIVAVNSDQHKDGLHQQHLHAKDRSRIDGSFGADVLVISLTKGHLEDRLSIVTDCWYWGFSADLQYEEANLSIVDALASSQLRGFSVVIAVRTAERHGLGVDLKVYNLVTKSATEVTRLELRSKLAVEVENIKSKRYKMSTAMYTLSQPILSSVSSTSNTTSPTAPAGSSTAVSDVQLILAASPIGKPKQKHKNKVMTQTAIKSAVAAKIEGLHQTAMTTMLSSNLYANQRQHHRKKY
ncbi:hypothetical protein SeMB42_g04625 [Synchytrium endobioticum]|uniref:non-specific serine/threonine protein kinase n=1 Tax=Synchytrium endobioticum TaxID=286115 RepID=A0A507CXV4_9FUNG|nr:hypothetical protein SeMB42_g04625 [Synchytrium endobioticum]